MNTKKIISLVIAAAAIGSFVLVAPVFAQSNPQGQGGGRFGGMARGGQKPAVMGTVSSVSGDTITVSGRQGFNGTTAAATYTVDAT